jgi:Tol biopolymer transport system component
MALSAGSRVGPFEIVAPIGAGGMGEVYRGRDPRLGRDVAIKVLPASVSTDAERLRRFEHEARATAALNHPNILVVYDVGRDASETYIVAELLEGRTLREALADGAMLVRKAVDVTIQLARGLAAAHEKGIVHRDLKPENIFITADERVKILDFGLAKLAERSTQDNMTSIEPTRFIDTTPGTVLGTVGYMAPEQVRGAPIDHRSDIFAAGAVLYEMLSGRRAFQAETTAETMTAILKANPPDLTAGDRQLPPALVRIVDRALEKNPGARFQSASDFAFALDGLSASQAVAAVSAAPAPPRTSRARLAATAAAMLGVAAVALGAGVYLGGGSVEPHAVTASILMPEDWSISGLAAPSRFSVSPDGRAVAFVAEQNGEHRQLWMRRLDAATARPLPGTEGAVGPFWSPDSRFIGFYAADKLRRIDPSGGPPTTICDAPMRATSAVTGTWNNDDVIVFGMPGGGGLYRVSASGGTAAPLLPNDRLNYTLPSFLPDGSHYLYRGSPQAIVGTDAKVFVGSLDGGTARPLLENTSQAVYTQGHVLFTRDGTLMAQPFDVKRLEMTGNPFPVAEAVSTGTGGNSAFSASSNGILVLQSGSAAVSTELTWFDRAGQRVGTIGEPRWYSSVALSPNAGHLVTTVFDTESRTVDLWILDVLRPAPVRFTFDPAVERWPIWSEDGRVIFQTWRDGRISLAQKAATGAGGEEILLASDDNGLAPLSVAPDGRSLLFSRVDAAQRSDLWILPLTGERTPVPFLTSPFHERFAQHSPDGRWVVYDSDDTGRSEVYIRPVQGSGEKWPVSTGGGTQPKWRGDGKEIYYINLSMTAVMRVPVGAANGKLEIGTPQVAAEAPMVVNRTGFDVSRDGQRLLVNVRKPTADLAPMTLVVNWLAGRGR